MKTTLSWSISWDVLSHILNDGYTEDLKCIVGRKRIDPLISFRMLLLLQLLGLANESLKLLVNDRR
jgi:hypothetical protein